MVLPYRGLGTGVRRALQVWPQIQFIDDMNSCLFTSRLARVKTKVAPINAPINVPLSDLQMEILELIKENPAISYEALNLKLAKDRTTIMRNIQKMKDAGVLRRVGPNKTGHWEIL